jgi:MoaA/NifB/PqqE/SkfB family radical SAM enzyme
MKPVNFSLLINVLLNQKNYKDVLGIVDFLVDLGIKEINLLNVSPLSEMSRTKEIVPKTTDMIPYLKDVMDKYSSRKDVKILLVEFPPCILPEEYRESFFPCLEENTNKIRLPICKKCEYSERCSGVLDQYIELYGKEEFV